MRKHILLVYPLQGFSGLFVQHAPISLLYASVELVRAGYEVEILDNRLYAARWQEELRQRLRADTLLVGVSVMSGKPIHNAIEISREVKRISADIHVVWGGPHATFAPASIGGEESVDFALSGYASKSLLALAQLLDKPSDSTDSLKGVSGLSYRMNGGWFTNPEQKAFERISFRDIPYHLIDDYRVYGQLEQQRTIFSMYSVLGCPYKCSFCSSPAQYRGIPGKVWAPLEVAEVADHVQYVHEQFGANYIYFIDDDSFVSLAHVEGVIDEISKRNIPVKLGFRGARINEIMKMSHGYLEKLAAAGTDMIHVGVETGSDRLLKLIRKNCTVANILDCNRKLAQHPQIRVGYNFMMGLPTETVAELHSTVQLWFDLLRDNPRAILFQPNKFRPLPGTELFELVQRDYQYQAPTTLAEWSEIEVEGDFSMPWYQRGVKAQCDLMLVGSYFVDNKILKVTEGRTWLYRVLRLASRLYRPIAIFRLRNNWSGFLLEYWFYQKLMGWVARRRFSSFARLPESAVRDQSDRQGVVLLLRRFYQYIRQLFPSKEAASR